MNLPNPINRWGVNDNGKVEYGGGGASPLYSSRSRSLVRPLRAQYAFVMMRCGGSEGASGRRSALARGAKDRVRSIGRARVASSSTG